jgi:site-specific DNA-cytosine methylase
VTGPRIGSLFTGTGALDMAVMDVLGGSIAWHCQYDPEDRHQYAARILEHHWPAVPNLGDITQVDWTQVEPVDVLTAGFPCFPAGTLITTSTGLRPIEDLAVGDMVLTHKRRYRPVIQTMHRNASKVLRVKAMGAPLITTTDEHPFYVRRNRDSAPEWIPAKDLQRGVFVALPDTDIDKRDVSEGELARWYLVGRWLGDGWTVTHRRPARHNSTARRVHWCCAAQEAEELETAFAKAGIRPTRVNERTVVKYVMQSNEWSSLLDDFGKRAYGKQLPEYVHTLPLVLQEAILQGWLDSDGDVKANGAINGTTTSRALAIGMARIARSVYGKAVSIHEGGSRRLETLIEGRRVNERPWWNVRISCGPSKQAFQADGFTWAPVRSVVTEDSTQEVFNIGVQDDESYVAEGVVVHNCQDLSYAGRGAGIKEGTRSGLWYSVADAIRALRPGLVFLENVRAIVARRPGLDVVLASLAELGFDAEWTCVRASDVGAPHRRERWFCLAWPADSDGPRLEGAGARRATPQRSVVAPYAAHLGQERCRSARDGRPGSENRHLVAADAGHRLVPEQSRPEGWKGGKREPERGISGSDGQGLVDWAQFGPAIARWEHERGRGARDGWPGSEDGDISPADPAGERHGDAWPARERGLPSAALASAAADADCDAVRQQPVSELGSGSQTVAGLAGVEWGAYGPAVHRWAHILGRPAPSPVDDRGRLDPRFVEWMMGLPEGHVCDVPAPEGMTAAGLRNARLKALGNGVVPAQAAYALRLLLERARGEVAA